MSMQRCRIIFPGIRMSVRSFLAREASERSGGRDQEEAGAAVRGSSATATAGNERENLTEGQKKMMKQIAEGYKHE